MFKKYKYNIVVAYIILFITIFSLGFNVGYYLALKEYNQIIIK